MAMNEQTGIVVVGAGIAGVTAVRGIRAANPDVAVTLVNGETRLPYRRPQLSRHIHCGFAREQFALEPESWYRDNAVEVLAGTQATRLDPVAKTLALTSGQVLRWDRLILATGAQARWPEGTIERLPGVFALRDADSAEALLSGLVGAHSVLIMGMGVLGIEIAEQTCQRGLATTMVHRGPAPMERELTPRASERLRQLLEGKGISLVFDREVRSVIAAADGLHVSWLGGERVVDRVVACVGATPNTALAVAAGLAVQDGVLVDGHLRTSCPEVYAAGDCAQLHGAEVCHLWHCAEAMGRCAGLNAGGTPAPYHIRPFRLKCEVFGDYFFSMGLPRREQRVGLHLDEHESDGVYQCFVFRGNRLEAAVMVGDRNRARRYEEAVWGHWPREQVLEVLPL